MRQGLLAARVGTACAALAVALASGTLVPGLGLVASAAAATPAVTASTGSGALTVHFTKLSAGTAVSYQLTATSRTCTASAFVAATTKGTSQSATVGGLINGVTYHVTVVGFDAANHATEVGTTTGTPYAHPARPTHVGATWRSGSRATVSWHSSSNTSRAPVRGYRVWRNGVYVGHVTGAGASHLVVTGVKSGHAYRFTVAAYGPGGGSAKVSTKSRARP